MTFWSEKEEIIEPVRPYRFKIMETGGGETGYWWWAKAATKPSFDVSKEEYQLINHKYKYPGILTWRDVNIKIIDYKHKEGSGPTKLHDIYKAIENSKYSHTSGDGLSKQKMSQNFVIEQLDADGNILEKWSLINAFIVSIDAGELSYDTEDLTSITLTVSYDTAELTQ